MALPTSGRLSIDDIRNELGVPDSSLQILSEFAGFSQPHAISDFYGYSSAPPSGLTPALITIPAQNNSTWTYRSANISSYIGSRVHVVFRYINGTAGTTFRGDVQLDDFNLGGYSFDPETSTHSFGTSTNSTSTYSSVSWAGLPTGTNQGIWNRDGFGTPSSGTGNTSGNTGSFYYYAETTGSVHGQYYWLRSPPIRLSTSTLSFYSAQNGDNCGSIDVYLDIIP